MNASINNSLFQTIKNEFKNYSFYEIEEGIMFYCLNSYGSNSSPYQSKASLKISNILTNYSLKTDLETIIGLFESLLSSNNINENGIVFTPQYIAEYIAENLFENLSCYNKNLSIIDPACGCGIFLITAIEKLATKYNVPIETIIKNNIYGIDKDKDNIRRCILILRLLCAKHGYDYQKVKPNIVCKDSLKCNWCKEFKLKSFDYIIGNPPYVNPHDMKKETSQYLKDNFITTQNGVFNIFYAFIEHAMNFLNEQGSLGYIVPNNFLTIKSALKLREYLQLHTLPKRILDFGNNMVFKPIRTYNCIIILSPKRKKEFEYYTMKNTENIEKNLKSIIYDKMTYNLLDKNSWKLVDKTTFDNLRKLESQKIPIKDFIRTGIATLRDSIYLVEKDTIGYFKYIGKDKLYLEPDIVKLIYKIPDLKQHSINDAEKHIIFPYVKNKNSFELIDEYAFKTKFPNAYQYLTLQKKILSLRDKGNGNLKVWYAYGRTQGLNKYGKKLLFPTFSNKPNFIYIDNENALFCNGYAIFENDKLDLQLLKRILNSRLMDYYISNTSYSIEGNYYCYQKKYIERFSIPLFSEKDIAYISKAPKEELDLFLWNYYNLK